MSSTLRRVSAVLLAILIAGALPSPAPAQPAKAPSTPGPLQVELGGKATRWCTAGAGRYLAFHLPDAGTLAVFDAAVQRVVKQIPVTGDVRLAGSREKLAVVLVEQNILQRYDLATLSREKLLPLPAGKPVRLAVMGSAGNGPLALWSEGKVELRDLDSLQPLALKGELLAGDTQYGFDLRVSADGRTFCGWTTGLTGQQFQVMRLVEQSLARTASPESYSFNERWIQPTANGQLFLMFDRTLFGHDFTAIAPGTLKDAVLLATEDPRFFLAIRGPQDKPSTVTICTTSDRRELYTTEPVEPLKTAIIDSLFGHLKGEPRAKYLPTYHLLLTIPDSNDRVVVRPLDLKSRLVAKGPYLYVTSLPPAQVMAGSTLNYPLQTISSSPKVSYKLEAGPTGMAASPAGQVTWKVRSPESGRKVRVVVSAAGADGTEALHSFELEVLPAGSQLATATPGPATPPTTPAIVNPTAPTTTPTTPVVSNPTPPATPAVPSPAAPAAPKVEFAQLDAQRLALPDGDYQVIRHTPKQGYILAGAQLAVTDADGVKVERVLKLPGVYIDVGFREGYLVGISNETKQIDQIDLKTLQVTRSKKLPFRQLTDLALHPTRAISYVAYSGDGKVPRYRFVMVDEAANEVREGDDLIGTWLEVEPGGKWMVSGYRDIYQKGNELLINPGQIHVVPKYGSIDWLMRYDIQRDGTPRLAEMKEEVGGNGQGLRMSADGKRVTYLSHVGYPQFSRNLPGWDPLDLKKLPVTYEVKDRATTYDLAFHPVLPIAASPGSGAAVFFDRETGQVQTRLEEPPKFPAGVELRRVYFSPNGRNVVIEVTVGGSKSLVRLPLKLTAEERAVIEEHNQRPPVVPNKSNREARRARQTTSAAA